MFFVLFTGLLTACLASASPAQAGCQDQVEVAMSHVGTGMTACGSISSCLCTMVAAIALKVDAAGCWNAKVNFAKFGGAPAAVPFREHCESIKAVVTEADGSNSPFAACPADVCGTTEGPRPDAAAAATLVSPMCQDSDPLACKAFASDLNKTAAMAGTGTLEGMSAEDVAVQACLVSGSLCTRTCVEATNGKWGPTQCTGKGGSGAEDWVGFEQTEKALQNTNTATNGCTANCTHFSNEFMHRAPFGEVTAMKYDAHVRENVLVPSQVKGVTLAACANTSVTLDFETAQLRAEYFKQALNIDGLFIVTNRNDICPGSSHVYRKATDASLKDGNKLVLTTTTMGMENLFHNVSLTASSSHAAVGTVDPTRRRLLSAREHHHGRKLSLLKNFISMVKMIQNIKKSGTEEAGVFTLSRPLTGFEVTSKYTPTFSWELDYEFQNLKLKKLQTKFAAAAKIEVLITPRYAGQVSAKVALLEETTMATIDIMVGPIPVVLVIKGQIDLSFKFNAAIKGPGLKITTDASSTGSAKWEKNNKKVQLESPAGDFHTKVEILHSAASSSLTASLIVTPSIHVPIPGIDMGVAVPIEAGATLTASSGCRNGYVKIDVVPFAAFGPARCSIEVDPWLMDLLDTDEEELGLGINVGKQFKIHSSLPGYPKCFRLPHRQLSAEHSGTSPPAIGPVAAIVPQQDRRRLGGSCGETCEAIHKAMENGNEDWAFTACPNDCSGNGYCQSNLTDANAGGVTTYACKCNKGWEGSQCNREEKVMTASGNSQSAAIIQPGMCPPAMLVKSAELGIAVCKNRVATFVCADPTTAVQADADIGTSLKKAAQLGRACSLSLSLFLCNNLFPAAEGGSESNEEQGTAQGGELEGGTKVVGRLLPQNFSECVGHLTECLGEDEATDWCTAAGPGQHGPLAAVAAANSLDVVAPTPEWGGKTAADGSTRPLYVHHSSCDLNTTELVGCPHREGFSNYIDHHVFAGPADADKYVVAELAKFIFTSPNASQDCVAARRDQLCAVHMPVCDIDGAPQKIREHECIGLQSMCPSVMATQWGVRAASDCTNNQLFYVRNFVGHPEHACGFNSTEAFMLQQRNVPEINIESEAKLLGTLRPLDALFVGIGVGMGAMLLVVFASLVVVRVIRSNSKNKNSRDGTRASVSSTATRQNPLHSAS